VPILDFGLFSVQAPPLVSGINLKDAPTSLKLRYRQFKIFKLYLLVGAVSPFPTERYAKREVKSQSKIANLKSKIV
jgi:hypothetical protein